MSKENRSTVPYCILNLCRFVLFWTIVYHFSAWWSWPWQHIYFNTCELLKFIGVMYDECMLIGCRLRKERTEFKASLYGIETQCPLKRKQSSFGDSDGDSVCSALACTARTAVGAAVHTFALSVRMGKSYWLCSFFYMSGFLTLAIEFRKKTSKLELTKGTKWFP